VTKQKMTARRPMRAFGAEARLDALPVKINPAFRPEGLDGPVYFQRLLWIR
jgi:hypothetical protein